MPKVYMMIGIQGSGKSTYSKILSKGLDIETISSDVVRTERPDLEERDIFPEVYRRCALILKSGRSLVYDATNVSPNVRNRFKESIRSLGIEPSSYETVAVYFEPDVEESRKRVEKRNADPNERYLPLDVIDRFATYLIEPQEDEGFSQIIRIGKTRSNGI